MVEQLTIATRGQGLHEVTAQVARVVKEAGFSEGLCTVFVRHRLVPEGDPFYRHDTEGPDDMPAHIKSALTQTSLSIPIVQSRLCLGTWQGLYLWEHRRRGGERELVVHIGA